MRLRQAWSRLTGTAGLRADLDALRAIHDEIDERERDGVALMNDMLELLRQQQALLREYEARTAELEQNHPGKASASARAKKVEDLAARARDLEQRGLTQDQIARQVKREPRTIRRWKQRRN